jgi:hypothetical protein
VSTVLRPHPAAWRRPFGCRRVVAYPSKLAATRLEREAKARGVKPDELLARLLEILGNDNLYAAILEL